MMPINAIRFARRLPGPVTSRPLSTSFVLYSGHNKWSKIKHKKADADSKKGSLYSKASREIVVAVRQGGSVDPELNSALAAVLKRYRSLGVPKDNIETSLKKAASKGSESGAQSITYEAVTGQVGLIIECVSDNPSRTATKIRELLSKAGARLTPVAFMFSRHGTVRVALEEGDDFDARLERLVEAAFEADAEDFEQEEPSEGVVSVDFICPPTSLAKLTSAVTAPGLCKELLASELVYSPVDPTDPPDEATVTKIENLVEALEENDDVVRVWTSLD
ncbi:YebC/PmpR family DNA-binding transcriptional regulator [Phanerochaete sordida]|uniref:YebC/PmpR family DNA-binding transcriptional regulator n=1 Tax=Phanerochaete sordida TaxID=48140 RepID=A0A9P3GMR5_9APHY|nr:YebC/PmpR family DNA-binding transcriptional regulator [Phanerochaete sordida]